MSGPGGLQIFGGEGGLQIFGWVVPPNFGGAPNFWGSPNLGGGGSSKFLGGLQIFRGVSKFSVGSPIFRGGVPPNFGGVGLQIFGGVSIGIRSMFGQYASYWNAFLFRIYFVDDSSLLGPVTPLYELDPDSGSYPEMHSTKTLIG